MTVMMMTKIQMPVLPPVAASSAAAIPVLPILLRPWVSYGWMALQLPLVRKSYSVAVSRLCLTMNKSKCFCLIG
jgi:hypothetical protein